MELFSLDELSLNVLDIAFNSVKAGASLIEIEISARTEENTLIITVRDNGCGFDVNAYKRCEENLPEKSGGKGLILFKESAEKTGGSFKLKSEKGIGTVVKASYILNGPNRAPLGDMAETIAALALCEGVDIVYTCSLDDKSFRVDTRQTENPANLGILKKFIRENTDFINKNRIF